MPPLLRDTRARILVVNTTGIGDTIFATAAIADLRESFPEAEIDVFVDRRRIGLVANNPRINQLMVYPGKFRQVRATVRKLRDRAYDVAIIQHANDPDIVPIVAAAKPRFIVGYESHTFSVLYGIKLPPADRAAGVHTIDARLALTQAIGAGGTHWHTELFPDDSKDGAARSLLTELGIPVGKAIALNIGGSAPRKRWPVEHWTGLAKVLASTHAPLIFLGGPEDELAAELIREQLGDLPQVHFALGKLGLMGDIALLRYCRAHVAGDTGLLHAGFALDVPSVALFGPNDPSWTGPHPKQQRAIVVNPPGGNSPPGYDARKDNDGRLMGTISVDSVADAVHRLTQDQ